MTVPVTEPLDQEMDADYMKMTESSEEDYDRISSPLPEQTTDSSDLDKDANISALTLPIIVGCVGVIALLVFAFSLGIIAKERLVALLNQILKYMI